MKLQQCTCGWTGFFPELREVTRTNRNKEVVREVIMFCKKCNKELK